jgi:hypothetical protein
MVAACNPWRKGNQWKLVLYLGLHGISKHVYCYFVPYIGLNVHGKYIPVTEVAYTNFVFRWPFKGDVIESDIHSPRQQCIVVKETSILV